MPTPKSLRRKTPPPIPRKELIKNIEALQRENAGLRDAYNRMKGEVAAEQRRHAALVVEFDRRIPDMEAAAVKIHTLLTTLITQTSQPVRNADSAVRDFRAIVDRLDNVEVRLGGWAKALMKRFESPSSK